jgi:type IV secretory pathway VirD2 relaxase
MLTDQEKPFRLRPRKPTRVRRGSEVGAWSSLYKAVMRQARMTRTRRAASRGSSAPPRKPYFQRCAIRATYTRNSTRGQWAAHGRYLSREGTQREDGQLPTGFNREQESINIPSRLNTWQQAGDEQIWKIIISPEFGERDDLQKLTCELMRRVEAHRLGAALEWVAIAHFNTEHPHVHVALRGVDRAGQPVRFRREFIQHGIRQIAENLCTQQLGYRTEFDAAFTEQREVEQHRFTSLDRSISHLASAVGAGDAQDFRVAAPEPQPRRPTTRAEVHNRNVRARLTVLQRMGLAEPTGGNEWRVRRDVESVLRGMQRVSDRQRTLAGHGTPLSDERLRIEATDGREWKVIEGRVLVHGEEENGRGYLMVEGTDACVHHVFYTPEIEAARNRGQLRTNSFVRLRRHASGGTPLIAINDFGSAELLLKNKGYMRALARLLEGQGMVPEEHGWGGWLGRYQAAVRKTALERSEALSRSQGPNTSRGR